MTNVNPRVCTLPHIKVLAIQKVTLVQRVIINFSVIKTAHQLWTPPNVTLVTLGTS